MTEHKQDHQNTEQKVEAKESSFFFLVKLKLGSFIKEIKEVNAEVSVRIERPGMLDFFKLLKLDTDLNFSMLLDVTVVDFLDTRPQRFEVVYHLLSLSTKNRIRVYLAVPESNPEVESLSSIWASANYAEREAWDMYGVKFAGHPDLRRILMYDEFKGYPLRKDYPVQGKQPRIALRSPEVRNTSMDLRRIELKDALVQIGSHASKPFIANSR